MADGDVIVEWPQDGTRVQIPSSSLPAAIKANYKVVGPVPQQIPPQPTFGSLVQSILNKAAGPSAVGRFAAGAASPTVSMLTNPVGVGQGGLLPPAQNGQPGFNFADAIKNLSPKNALDATLSEVKGLNPVATDKFASGDTAGGMGQTLANLVMILSGGRKAAQAALPSKSAAGAAFNNVMALAKDVPVDVNGPGAVALRMKDMADAGAKMPMVVRKFLNRVTDPNAGPMPYSEARDFYSNATRISSAENNALTGAMQRELGKFTRSLNDSIGQAADKVGQGQAYSGAMGEYAAASRRAKAVQNVKDLLVKEGASGLIKGTGYGAGGVLGYKIVKAATGN